MGLGVVSQSFTLTMNRNTAAGLRARAGAALPRSRPARCRERELRRRAAVPSGPFAGLVEAAGDVEHKGKAGRERVLAAGKGSGARLGVQRGTSGLPAPSGEMVLSLSVSPLSRRTVY